MNRIRLNSSLLSRGADYFRRQSKSSSRFWPRSPLLPPSSAAVSAAEINDTLFRAEFWGRKDVIGPNWVITCCYSTARAAAAGGERSSGVDPLEGGAAFKQALKVFFDLFISCSNHEIEFIVTLFSLFWQCSPNQLLLAFLRPSSERRSERRRPVGGEKRGLSGGRRRARRPARVQSVCQWPRRSEHLEGQISCSHVDV